MSIKFIDFTSKPLTLMGEVASRCWNSKPSPRIGIDCIESGHHRVLEYPDIIIEIKDYSARMIRELYTHIIGVTRLQASTRYIDYGEFNYFIPPSVEMDENALFMYNKCMRDIQETYTHLQNMNIPKQDIANILPLGMMTTVVLKINLRALLHMAEMRTCSRAYHEFRSFMQELKQQLICLNDEWKFIIENYFKAKCEVAGYCTEKVSCGKIPHK